jgi:hypothetical protein
MKCILVSLQCQEAKQENLVSQHIGDSEMKSLMRLPIKDVHVLFRAALSAEHERSLWKRLLNAEVTLAQHWQHHS